MTEVAMTESKMAEPIIAESKMAESMMEESKMAESMIGESKMAESIMATSKMEEFPGSDTHILFEDNDNTLALVKQTETVFRKLRPFRNRRDTFFYKIVLGGNVTVTKKMVKYMENNDKIDVLDWLLRRKNQKASKCFKKMQRLILMLKRLFVFLLLILWNVLLTPVFYLFHTFTTAALTSQKRRISAVIRLPLVFALFSRKEEMWKYFLSLGSNVMDSDRDGNNAFHYIADLSAESPERAVTMFKLLVQYIDDIETVQTLLLNSSNTAGLSAVDYASKYGCPSLLTEILQHPNIMEHTVLAVGTENVKLSTNRPKHTEAPTSFEADTKVSYVDVTKYECGSFLHQSSLLNLLSDRSIATMSDANLQIFHSALFVGRYMSMKMKQMIAGVAFLHLCDILLTFAIFLTYYSNSSIDPYHEKLTVLAQKEFLSELECLSSNKSSCIFKVDSYHRIINNIRYHEMKSYMQENYVDFKTLFEKAASESPKLKDYSTSKKNAKNPSDGETPNWVFEALAKTAMKSKDYENDHIFFHTILHFPEIIMATANGIYNDEPQLFKGKLDKRKTDEIAHTTEDYVRGFTFSFRNQSYYPWRQFPENLWSFETFTPQLYGNISGSQALTDAICVNSTHFEMSDINLPNMHFPTDKKYISSACEFKVMFNMANNECSQTSPQDVYAKIKDRNRNYMTPFMERLNYMGALLLTGFFSFVYVCLDVFERCAFTYLSVANKFHMKHMLTAALSTKLPGSYLRKQINTMSTLYVLVSIFSDVAVSDLAAIFSILNLVLRFILHIHSLRLLPGIGHFVITTFMMGMNLIHFSAVYGIVLFVFGFIFNMLIDDPECPVEKHDGFHTLFESMFSTFRLTFGHGTIDPFFLSSLSKVTYTLYVIIVGLLLMNLIIAIMSSTATDIMAEPWKDTLWRMEWLEEALSAEYTFSVLGLPWRCCCTCQYISHQNAGFVVTKDEQGKYKMYIEVFHCPALD